MKKHRLKIGLDVDDTLYECNAYALKIINEKYPDEEPVTIHDIKGWGMFGRHAEERIALYSDPHFVETQPVCQGAQKLVRELSRFADIFLVTAVPAKVMTARAERLLKDFPEVPPQNIIIGTRKDVVALDILLDDGPHNIQNSKADYPVLFRKPWNASMTGMLAVNNYNDFLQLCKMVRDSFNEKEPDLTDGGVICLVGPTGSMKNEIAKLLTEDERFEKPVTTTTRPRREGEEEGNYRFVTEEEFVAEKDNDEYIETTVYSGYHFGTKINDIAPIIRNGHYAVIPIDICGALSIKNEYRRRALLVFVNRMKADVIRDIIERKTDEEDKVRRIMSLDFEYRNLEICDLEVKVLNDGKVAADTIRKRILSYSF